jgi:hypothetical protein
VLEIRPDGWGGRLGAEREVSPGLLLREAVDLFLDDVGGSPDAALEQAGLLEGGGADLAVAVAPGDLLGLPLDVSPHDGLVGQNVPRAARRLIRFHLLARLAHGDLLHTCARLLAGHEKYTIGQTGARW